MIGAIIRSLGSVMAGLIVALIFVIGVEAISSILHPFPPGVDPSLEHVVWSRRIDLYLRLPAT